MMTLETLVEELNAAKALQADNLARLERAKAELAAAEEQVSQGKGIILFATHLVQRAEAVVAELAKPAEPPPEPPA